MYNPFEHQHVLQRSELCYHNGDYYSVFNNRTPMGLSEEAV